MNLVDEIRQSWGWTGIEPAEIVGENDFGNLIIKDQAAQYWRLCPEDCSCEIIAANRCELDALSKDQDFLRDWNMSALVSQAVEKCGQLTAGRKYCLKIPSALDGEYNMENIETAPQVELIRFSGDIARQIKDLPNGAQVKLRVID